MALTVIGRYSLPVRPYAPVQDPEDFDSFYFIGKPDTNWRFYKFTWPNTLVVLADLGTILDNKDFNAATIEKNFSTLLGDLDTTPHYVLIYGTPNVTTADATFLEINCTTGAFSTWAPSLPGGSEVQRQHVAPIVWPFYTTSGTIFAASIWIGGYTCWAYFLYGEMASGNDVDWGASNGPSKPIYEIAGPALVGFDSTNFQSASVPSFTLSGAITPAPLKPRSEFMSEYGYSGFIYDVALQNSFNPQSAIPQLYRAWDDNWQYFFAAGIYGAGDYDLWYFRKNAVTGTYGYEFVALNDGLTGDCRAAFDIYESNGNRRIYFSHGWTNTIYSSPAWPFAVDGEITLDTGVEGACLSVHTAEDGYVYGFIYGGTTYGNQIVKIVDSLFEAEVAAPSLGGIGARLLFKDKRVFFIGVPGYGKYLWWGQPLEPQSLDVGWDGFNTTVFDDEDNTSINALDDNIYVGSQKGFIRLRGKSPDSWVLDQTLATTGPLSDKTASVTPFGLIYPRENGLWLFNGFTSTLFFEKGKNLLSNVNWDSYERAFSLWDGRYYRLFYPSGSSTENDRELIVDLIGGIENARGTEGDRAATFGFADLTTNTVYLGDASGNLMTLGGTTSSRSFSLTTKEYPCANLLDAGTFSALHYDIDLAGATLSIIPICDGVEKTAITITNTTRTRSKVSLPKGNYYRVGFRFEVTTEAAVKFYDPWYIE